MSGAQQHVATKTQRVLPARTAVGAHRLAADLDVNLYERPWTSQKCHAYAVLPNGFEAAGYGDSPDEALGSLAAGIGEHLRGAAEKFAREKRNLDSLMALVQS